MIPRFKKKGEWTSVWALCEVFGQFGKLCVVKPDEVPFICCLCMFCCRSWQQLEQHIVNFAPHVDRVTKEKWEDNGRCVLVRSPNPYKFSQLDYIQLSSDQSVQYFLKTASIRTPKSCTPDLLARACQKLQAGSLEEDLTISTLRDGYISPSPVEMTSQGQELATSSYSEQAPAAITANPVSVAAHRTETMTSTQELSNDCALDLST